MGNNEPAVDQSDFRIRDSYGLNIYVYICDHICINQPWNSEISTPLNNDLYTEYADVFSFLFRLSTVKLFGFSLLEMYA